MAIAAGSAAMQVDAQNDQAKDAGRAGAFNAAISSQNAKNLEKAAAQQAEQIFAEAARLRGAQLVQMAGSGVMLGVGGTAAIVDDTENLAARDALVIMQNAAMGAYEQDLQGKIALMSSRSQIGALRDAGTATLLGLGASTVNTYSTYKQLTTKTT